MRGFLAIVLGVWTGMHIYVFWRLRSIPVLARVPGFVFAVVGIFLWASYVIAHVLDHYVLAGFFEIVGANWVGILFLLLICFSVVDIVTVFGWAWPNFAVRLRVCPVVAAGLLSSIALVQGHRAPAIVRYEVALAGLLGVGLMVSGHTHDGQIWRFGYVVGLTHPFLAGQYEVNGMPLIVCRGTGTWGPRMRLWRRGEIARITLRSNQATQR